MYCKNCHFEFEPQDLKCPACGSSDIVPITEKPTEDYDAHKKEIARKKRSRNATFIIGVVSIIIGKIIQMVGTFYYGQATKTAPQMFYSVTPEQATFDIMIKMGNTLLYCGVLFIIIGFIQFIIWDVLLRRSREDDKNQEQEKQ